MSSSTVKRYQQRRESGSLGHKPIPRRPRAIPPEQQALWAQLVVHPDATLVEHCRRWQAAHGVTVCFSNGAGHQRLGWTRKKTLVATERNTVDRVAWREAMAVHDARRFVFVDESRANITLTPRSARAPKGEQAHGAVPRNYRHNTTLVAALTSTGIQAP